MRLSWPVGSAEEALALVVAQNVTAEKEAEAELARLKRLLPMCA